jgi:hypothetical protein
VYKRQVRTPIEIVNREVSNRPFSTEGTIIAGPEWIKDLTLTVRNVSDKTIIKFEILLTVPKQGDMPTDAGMLFSFPQPERLLGPDGKLTGDYKPLVLRTLAPNSTVKVQIWQHQLKILEDIKNQGVSDVEVASISIRQVLFDDGTGWYLGRLTRESPEEPNHQIFVKRTDPLSLRLSVS